MATRKLTERILSPFSGARVNREAGTIGGVLICGTESANGRDYPAAVLRRDHAVYEGAVVNCDHARESTVDRRFGWFTDVTPGDDGRPRGTLNVLLEHPMAARVFEAAERNPALFGFSHVAMCETTRGKNGREVVEAIKSVESIDLVASPATTKGLFESKGSAVKISLKQFAERVGPKLGPDTWGALTKLLKEDEFADMADVPAIDEPAADATDGDLKSGLIAALQPLLEDAFETGNSDKLCAACRDFVKLHAKHTGGGGDEADTETETDDADDSAKESKKPTLSTLFAECKAAGLTETSPELLEALADTPSQPARAFLIRTAREAKANAAAAADRPRGGHRPPGAGEAAGGRKVEAKEPAPEFCWQD